MSVSRQRDLEEVLTRLARSRTDEESWRSLFTVLWPFVFAANYRSLQGEISLAEDASQEVFIRIVRYARFDEFNSSDAFLAYVRVLCRNVVRTTIKKIAKSPILRGGSEDISEAPDTMPTPEHAAASSQVLRQILAGVDPRDRELLTFVARGLSLDEIAARMGDSYTSIGVRLHRLRRALLRRSESNAAVQVSSHSVPSNTKKTKE